MFLAKEHGLIYILKHGNTLNNFREGKIPVKKESSNHSAGVVAANLEV